MKQSNVLKSFLIGAFCFLSLLSSVYAKNFGLSAQLGLSNLHVGSSTIQVTPTETDTLHQQENPNVPEFTLGLNYLVPLPHIREWHGFTFFPALVPVLNFRYIKQEITGEVWQYQEPAMNNYNYNLSIDSLRFMLDVALILFSYQEKTSFFIFGGVGNAWNQIGYQDTAVPGVPGGELHLNNRTNSGFVYELGGGIFYPLDQCMSVFLEYRYAHFPKIRTASSGTLDGIPVNVPSATFPFYSQTISFGINWNL